MDITDQPSIDSALTTITSLVREAGLVGLVNNAGIAVAGPLEFLPVTELRKQLEVNVTGQLAVTQAFLPLIRKGQGRIVNVGSISGRLAFPLLGPYCASKFALEALTAALRMELQPWGIKVIMLEPAGIRTPIWRKALAAGERMGDQMPPEAFALYGPIIEGQRSRAKQSDSEGVHPKYVVRAVVHALTSEKPPSRYFIGQRAVLGEVLRLLPERLRERLILSQMER
jgi:NAD(P)-dependent dehydrogenase (short-subunit alcohol dehydrogenase family)